MSETLAGGGVFAPSDAVVAREIEGEVVIVPLSAGVGDLEDELYALNETGRAVWRLLDGVRTLDDVVAMLAGEYDASRDEIERDVRGLLVELVNRGIAREVV